MLSNRSPESTIVPTRNAFSTTAADSDKAMELANDIWRASQDVDDTLFRPPSGWWPISGWASLVSLIWRGSKPVGVVGLAPAVPTGQAEARIALLPEERSADAAQYAVDVATELAARHGDAAVTVVIPGRARWAQRAARERGFKDEHSFHVLERPGHIEVGPAVRTLPIEIVGTENLEELRHALNQAYAGSPGFSPISSSTLGEELAIPGSRFFVSRLGAGQIAATAHLRFSAGATNPGGGPYAWLSNLTVSPVAQGLGLGRAMLRVAIRELQAMGATSTVLGVDSRNVRAGLLYQSEGFQSVGTLEFWTKRLNVSDRHPVR